MYEVLRSFLGYFQNEIPALDTHLNPKVSYLPCPTCGKARMKNHGCKRYTVISVCEICGEPLQEGVNDAW